MLKLHPLYGIFLSVFLLSGCFSAAKNAQPTSLTTLQLSGGEFQIEIAETVAERTRGLMQRTSLPANHGMLFIFPEPQILAFWMKDTLIPLDILYFDAEQQLTEILADTQPCYTEQCPSYLSQQPVKYVLELNAGKAKEIDAKLGEKFELPTK